MKNVLVKLYVVLTNLQPSESEIQPLYFVLTNLQPLESEIQPLYFVSVFKEK